MRVTITLFTHNAAFQDHVGTEVSRMLLDLGHKLCTANDEVELEKMITDIEDLWDRNGNKVGNIKARRQ